MYLKKAQFDGRSFRPISMHVSDPGATAVKANSPYKTMKAQGYNLISDVSRGTAAPAGTPNEIIEVLDAAVKKAMDSATFKEGMAKLKQPARYMNQAEYAAFWKDMEATIRPLMPLVLN